MSYTKPKYEGSSWLLFIAILLMTVLLAGTALSSKIIAFSQSFLQPGSTVVYPIAFLLSGVIAEIYGYDISKKLIIFIILSGYIFAFLIEAVLMLPSPLGWDKQEAYQAVFGNILRFSTAGTLGIIVGLFTNSYIITKTKWLVCGKYFWLRALGAVAVGEFAHIAVMTLFLFYKTDFMNNLLHIILTMYFFRMVSVLILITPVQILVSFIKKSEGIDEYRYEVHCNLMDSK